MARRGGFTLIELIITIAIAPILFGAVFAIAGFAARSNNHSAINQDIQFRAQVVIENIKAREEIKFLTTDSSETTEYDKLREEIRDFTDITVTDKNDPAYEEDLTVYEQRANIMGQDFTIRLEDKLKEIEKISEGISPRNSSLLIPSPTAPTADNPTGNRTLAITVHTVPEIWCEYRGEIFYPDEKDYDKADKSSPLFQHFYLIAQGDNTDRTAGTAQTVTVAVAGTQTDEQHIVLNVIYADEENVAEDDDENLPVFSTALPDFDPEDPKPLSAVIPEADATRLKFSSYDPQEDADDIIELNWANPKPDNDVIGWLKTEEHSLTLTFTDADGRQWSSYETGYTVGIKK